MVSRLVLLFLSLVLVYSSPPTFETIQKGVIYSYASACRIGVLDWTCYWCTLLSMVPPVKVTLQFQNNGIYGIYGYVGHSKEEIVVAFRGSSSLDNWIHDIDIRKIPYGNVPGAQIHNGFWTAYKLVKNQIEPHLLDLHKQFPHLPIVINGHSLGAALGVILSLEISHNSIINPKNITVINFGQPRVGNKEFALYFEQTIGTHYRVVHKTDPVPHLPLKGFGFYHSGPEIWFQNETSYTLCNGGEDPKCSDSVKIFSVLDHLHYADLFSGAGRQCCQCGGPVV